MSDSRIHFFISDCPLCPSPCHDKSSSPSHQIAPYPSGIIPSPFSTPAVLEMTPFIDGLRYAVLLGLYSSSCPTFRWFMLLCFRRGNYSTHFYEIATHRWANLLTIVLNKDTTFGFTISLPSHHLTVARTSVPNGPRRTSPDLVGQVLV
jgi:hypothetical protein